MSQSLHGFAAVFLLAFMFFLAGGAALRESVTVDEVPHLGAGLSYLQRFDLRLNAEHPPLGKALAALPLALRGTRADYSGDAWKLSADFFPAYVGQWVFGDAVLGRWNDWKSTLLWARFPMLVLTLLLGWFLYVYGQRLGGEWGGLLCLAAYVTAPVFLVFGPLVITDLPVTLFSVVTLWQLGEVWTAPSRRNARLLGLALGAALLSKFTGLVLIPVILAFFVHTRFWPTPAEPLEKGERKAWRKARWRAVLRGVVCAALLVYVVYFVLSWNQSNEALNRVGSGEWASLLRRPLMPVWLYCRGVLLMLSSGSRPTFLLGHSFAHGVPFYFPVVFLFKSTLGFLLLLVLAAGAGLIRRKGSEPVIPDGLRPHWRALLIGFFVFLAICLLSRLDIGIRHFMVPIALLTLMLAPLPRLLGGLPRPQVWQAACVVLTLSSAAAVLRAYPYLFPFVNSLALGRPPYYLLNDSNVTWNEALPEVERFVQQQHLHEIRLDYASAADPTVVVPETKVWDCQSASAEDAGQWAVVSAGDILESHNCAYLQQYPHRELAGGAFYAFQLPATMPAAGTPGGPPLASEYKLMWGLNVDLRSWTVNVQRHPERLRAEVHDLLQKLQQPANALKK